jgi:carboxypeptidase PM20D1
VYRGVVTPAQRYDAAGSHVKRLALVFLVVLLGILGIAAIRTLGVRSRQPPPGTPATIEIDARAAADRLAGAIRFPTVSWGDATRRDTAAFLALHDYLVSQFPGVSRDTSREVIATYSLLYTWPGRRSDLPPLILAAHLDVVPAETTGRSWQHPPFSGAITADSIWGRGAIDDKSGVMGILEAVEALIASGFTPERTVYLAFGHNEEGDDDASGAGAIAAHLGRLGVHDAWLLDEGGLIYDRVVGVPRPVALVGIAEKNPLIFELRVSAAGGHASMPPRESAVGILGRALDRLEHHPMRARLDGAAREMFTTLTPEMSLPMRAVFANLWLTKPVVLWRMGEKPEVNPAIRTTVAPTMLEASPKANVLATSARAVLNVRLLPGDSPEAVAAHMRSAIADDRVEVLAVAGAGAPSVPISPTGTAEFARLQSAIRAVYPDVVVSPYLTMAATDSRFYIRVAPNIYRFLPVSLAGALEAVHGVDEHVRIDAYEKGIRIYATIIKELAGK